MSLLAWWGGCVPDPGPGADPDGLAHSATHPTGSHSAGAGPEGWLARTAAGGDGWTARAATLAAAAGRLGVVVDRVDPAGLAPPSLGWVACGDTACAEPVDLAVAVGDPSDAFLPVAALPGDGDAWVLTRDTLPGGALGTASLRVDPDTGAVRVRSTTLATGLAGQDHGRSALALDGPEAHTCYTYPAPGGDDVVVDHTTGGQWAVPRRDDLVLRAPGVQDHCSVAVRSDGTRAFAWHGGADVVEVALEDAPGHLAPGFPLALAAGGPTGFDHPALALHGGDPADRLDVVYEERGVEGEVPARVWHRRCAAVAPADCADPGAWSAPVEVTPDLVLDGPPFPRVAVDAAGTVYVALGRSAPGGSHALAVRARCAGAGAFVDLGAPGTGVHGFGASAAGEVLDRLATGAGLAVDGDRLHLAFVELGGDGAVARVASRPVLACP